MKIKNKQHPHLGKNSPMNINIELNINSPLLSYRGGQDCSRIQGSGFEATQCRTNR
jgi:hypothetical protein